MMLVELGGSIPLSAIGISLTAYCMTSTTGCVTLRIQAAKVNRYTHLTIKRPNICGGLDYLDRYAHLPEGCTKLQRVNSHYYRVSIIEYLIPSVYYLFARAGKHSS
ncbi:hypothetical protein F5Y11DRAFT_43841 [Daldinia sp. FL1419]|nr:hypothetical protein F5Y11DRAFT_43841 [Daldinia sp. FL1419]